jgi:hypothetical protein
MPWASASSVFSSFYVISGIILVMPLVYLRTVSGIVIPWLLISGLIVSIISRLVISWLVSLLSQEPNLLVILYEFFY